MHRAHRSDARPSDGCLTAQGLRAPRDEGNAPVEARYPPGVGFRPCKERAPSGTCRTSIGSTGTAADGIRVSLGPKSTRRTKDVGAVSQRSRSGTLHEVGSSAGLPIFPLRSEIATGVLRGKLIAPAPSGTLSGPIMAVAIVRSLRATLVWSVTLTPPKVELGRGAAPERPRQPEEPAA